MLTNALRAFINNPFKKVLMGKEKKKKTIRGCLGEKKNAHSSLIAHHSVTHFLSPNNPQISPKPSLAP